jgi:hypothetical protein
MGAAGHVQWRQEARAPTVGSLIFILAVWEAAGPFINPVFGRDE